MALAWGSYGAIKRTAPPIAADGQTNELKMQLYLPYPRSPCWKEAHHSTLTGLH